MGRLLGLPLLCLLAVTRLAFSSVVRNTAGSARSARRSQNSAAAAASWAPMDLGLGAAGDLPLPGEGESDQVGLVAAPGEAVIEDEMTTMKRPLPMALQQQAQQRPQPLLASSASRPVQSLAAMGASVESGYVESSVQQTAPQVPKASQAKVLEEYDVTPDDEDDDYRTTQVEETKTKEEVERQQRGDVEHIKPVQHKKTKLLVRKFSVAAATKQQHSEAVVSSANVADQAPGNDKLMAQCMSFAGWVKGQGSTGPDLVRIWKGTCMPAVMAGDAPPAFSNMCNALGTAVSRFAVRPWAPADLCQAVLQVFKESGVGATPLL